MSDKLYNILKWIAQIVLPAITVFVGVVLQCFNCECTATVITIMTAFDTMMGAILGVSTAQYKKASEEVDEEDVEE